MNGLTMKSRKSKKKNIWKHENEHTATEKQWDTVMAILTGKFIAIQAYLKKIGKPQTTYSYI